MSSSGSTDGSSTGQRPSGGGSGGGGGGGGWPAVMQHLSNSKTDAMLMLTRGCTVLFTILYMVPILGGFTQYSCYQKVLIANAATSALRLHQRLPPFRLSREFMARLLFEDSAHYLLYSIIFLYTYPITLVLLPIALFALLHLSSYTLILLDKAGRRNSSFGQNLSHLVETYQSGVLQTVAFTEIILMPIIICSIFTGVGSLFTPFIYYRFIASRYASLRNPYTRQMFHTLRLNVESLVYKPGVPMFIRTIVYRLIAFISRLAPPLPHSS